MKISDSAHFTHRNEWRAWLQQNHDSCKELWMIFYKQESGHTNISLEDAIEEALCFGWIDSIIQKIDDERYGRKFTPRTNERKWSAVNLRRAQKMIAAGRMTEAGLARIDSALLSGDLAPHQRPSFIEVPPFVAKALEAHPPAWENFNHLAPSHRRNYLGWILDAKKDETRHKRLAEAIEKLMRNEKLGMK